MRHHFIKIIGLVIASGLVACGPTGERSNSFGGLTEESKSFANQLNKMGAPVGKQDSVELPEEFDCGNDAKKVSICHIPPGNPDNRHNICVAKSALNAHMNHCSHHGQICDYLGPCVVVPPPQPPPQPPPPPPPPPPTDTPTDPVTPPPTDTPTDPVTPPPTDTPTDPVTPPPTDTPTDPVIPDPVTPPDTPTDPVIPDPVTPPEIPTGPRTDTPPPPPPPVTPTDPGIDEPIIPYDPNDPRFQ